MLQSREVADLVPTCPAGAPVGETIAGSAVLCRVTGNLITTGENPASLRAFCCNSLPLAKAQTAQGEPVEHGYQACPVWVHNRHVELQQSDAKLFVSPHST